MNKMQKARKLVLTIIVLFFAIAFLLPLLWMISSSLKNPIEVFESPFHWIPTTIHWENYAEVWTNPSLPFWRFFLNSIIVTGVSVTGQLFVASLAAYAFAKIDFKGKNVVFMIMLMTMMIPMQALVIPRFMLFYSLKLYDSLWCVILPNFFNITSIFLLRQFYASLPDELMEAAQIDGAGHLQIWARIMMPLTKNGMTSAAVLAFISSWNEYLNSLIFLPSTKNYTIALGIRWYLNDSAREYNLMMCAAASAIIPIVIFYVFAQRLFEDSISASGVKG